MVRSAVEEKYRGEHNGWTLDPICGARKSERGWRAVGLRKGRGTEGSKSTQPGMTDTRAHASMSPISLFHYFSYFGNMIVGGLVLTL